MMARNKTEARRSIYGVHPAVAMVRKWIEDLPEKTGRSLDYLKSKLGLRFDPVRAASVRCVPDPDLRI